MSLKCLSLELWCNWSQQRRGLCLAKRHLRSEMKPVKYRDLGNLYHQLKEMDVNRASELTYRCIGLRHQNFNHANSKC